MLQVIKQTFHDRLQLIIDQKAGGSASELARMSGLTRTHISTIMKQKIVPKLDTAAAICLATGVSLQWLATGEGPMLASQSEVDIEALAARIAQKLRPPK